MPHQGKAVDASLRARSWSLLVVGGLIFSTLFYAPAAKAQAVPESGVLAPPRLSVGGGIGCPDLLHVNVSGWLSPHITLEFGAGGFIFIPSWATVNAGVALHIGSAISRHALLLEARGGYGGMLAIGGGWSAPLVTGGVGYRFLGRKLDMRVLVGVTVLPTEDSAGRFLPYGLLTFSRAFRW